MNLPARLPSVMHALETISQFARLRNIGGATLARLNVAVEELATNTIKYGYGGECDRPIRIALAAPRDADMVELTYEDEAAPFDPLDWHARWQARPIAGGREPGGRGIALVVGLSRGAAYSPLAPGNRLRLRIG